MMLDHMGKPHLAHIIQDSLKNMFQDKNNWTKDIGGECGTKDFTERLIKKINEMSDSL